MNFNEIKEICKKIASDTEESIALMIVGNEGNDSFCGLNGNLKNIVIALASAAMEDKHARQIILTAAELINETGKTNE